MMYQLIALLIVLLLHTGDAFYTPAQALPRALIASSTTCLSLKTDASDKTPDASDKTRRNILDQCAVVSAMMAFPVPPAHADVANKVASSTALRALTNIRSKLPTKLLPVTQSNNYVGVKTSLREPPLDGIRKNMLVVVRGGEDGPKAGELLLAYKQLIKSLEDIDATASLGMRGSKMDPFQLSIQYDAIEKAMDLFIKVGAEAANIPLQEMTDQTQVGSIDIRTGKVTPRVI